MDNKKAVKDAFAELAPRYEKVVDLELRRIWGWSYQEFVDQLLSLTTINDDDIILDIATGTGVIPLRLNKVHQNGSRIVGLDITFSMLQHATQNISSSNNGNNIKLTCASSMEMPFTNDSFNLITCGLATHHMDIHKLISEIRRVLKHGGRLTIADVGAAPSWKLLPVRIFLYLAAFIYFLPAEGWARAWAETRAIENIYTADEWEAALAEAGFTDIKVSKLKSRHFWAPTPIALKASKNGHNEGTVNADRV